MSAGVSIRFEATRPEGVPEALRSIPQWLVYKGVPETRPDGTPKLNKIPLSVRTGGAGSSIDPETWGTFDQAREAMGRHSGRSPFAGMGFAFTTEAEVIAIDLDHCVNDAGEVHPEALAFVEGFPGAWVELSPSGSGLHLWMRGKIEGLTSLKRPPGDSGYPFGVELFGNRFFMTVTGIGCDGTTPPEELPDHTEALVKLHKELGGTGKRSRRPGATPLETPAPIFDAGQFEAEVIAKLPDAGGRESYTTPEGVEALRWEVDCPNKAEHTGGGDKAVLLFFQEGGPRFKCLHSHCGGIHWQQFAERRGVKWTAPLLTPIEAARAGCPFAMTDLGNAERLVALHGESFLWDVARRRWLVWDGKRWAPDSALRINNLAADTVRRIRQEAAAAPAGGGQRDLGRDLFTHAVKSESRDRLAAMIEVAKSRPGVATAPEVFDADPWALNVANGTIDLRTGLLRPHTRGDMLTKLAPVEYRPGVHDERWEKFLLDATGEDVDFINFLQVVAGYTLSGLTVEEILILIFGPENSGKTTFLEALRSAMGDYSRTVQADLLAKKKDHNGGGGASPELVALVGARLAAGSEMEQGRELAEALVKNLTGGESITARQLYGEMFDFVPQFKLWLAVNHCPKASADDGAIWRRMVRVGFSHTVPPEKRDKTLKPYLRDPKGGGRAVLAWAVEGCLRWQREGLKIPEAVRRSTEAYREESDPLANFFEDCLKFTPGAWTPWTEILKAYQEHAEDNGTPERYRVSAKRIQDRLKGKGGIPERRKIGRGWCGVELKNPNEFGGGDGGDTGDTISQTFPHEGKAGETLGNAVTAVTGVTTPQNGKISFRRLPAPQVAL
jgi:putative DNA primase/helicase